MLWAVVPQNKVAANAFFQDAGNVEALERLLAGFTPDQLGCLESEEDMQRRWEDEFAACKEKLEKETGRPARTWCWPWGRFSAESREAAKKAGFAVFVTTALGSNRPGLPEAVKRLNIKVRSAESLLRRLNLYNHPIIADIYQNLQFKWKFKRRAKS